MQVACPNCGTKYQIKAEKIGAAGRTLKCAKCQTQWFVPPLAPPEPAPVALPPDDLPPLPPQAPLPAPALDELAGLRQQPRWWRAMRVEMVTDVLLTLLGLVLAAAALAGVGWLVRHGGRDDLALPEQLASRDQAKAARAVHQPGPQPESLQLGQLSRVLKQDGADMVLVIKGRLVNAAPSATVLPDLRVQLLDRNGAELDYWPADYVSATLPAGKGTDWQAVFVNPPLDRLAAYRAFFVLPAGVSASGTKDAGGG